MRENTKEETKEWVGGVERADIGDLNFIDVILFLPRY